MRRIVLFILITCLCLTKMQAQTANFSASVVSGCSPVVTNFKDASTGNIVSWQWDLGNGVTSDKQNPSTTYFTEGAYTIILTVTDAAGRTNTLRRTAYIIVYGNPVIDFKAVDSAGCFPVRSQFTDFTIPGYGTTNTQWQWDLGNGIKSTQQHPYIIYKDPGSYSVALKVINDKGCYAVAVKSAYIKVASTGVVADFGHTQPTTCRPPFSIGFTSIATGPGTVSYNWDFGDGGKGSGVNTTHSYTAPGTYVPALIVTSSAGCRDTIKKAAPIIIQNITTAFSAPDSICLNSQASLSNLSTPAPSASVWKFGDGTTATGANAVKAFSAPGTYTVILDNTYSYCTDSAKKNIKVLPRAVPAFSAAGTSKCSPPFAVNFTNTTTGGNQYYWDFGDGATSTNASPSHTYNTYGEFTVKLVVTTASGCVDSLIMPQYIKVKKPVPAVPYFPVNGCVPLTINPIDASSVVDGISTYTWDFGDNTTSNSATPSHTYTAQGEYTVKLTIVSNTGCTETLTIPGAVRAGRKPVIDFTAVPNPVCGNQVVNFTDATNESPVQWQWLFGDGSGAQNTPTPSHQYTDTGYKSITLTVTTAAGCTDYRTKTDFIKVKPPIAHFKVTPDCTNRQHFSFTDNSVFDAGTAPLQWLWDFGDGSAHSNLKNPDHQYVAPGSYNVTLTVTNGDCSNSISIPVRTIQEKPQFTASATEACKTATITFTATAINTSNIQYYTWNYGYGTIATTSTRQDVVYPTSGEYTVKLTTTDIYGCLDSFEEPRLIKIKGPVANFTSTTNTGCKGLTATFNDASAADNYSPLQKWIWNFGDGSAPLTVNSKSAVTHSYNDNGSFAVKLTTIDASGCADSLSLNNFVRTSSPKADFVSADTLSCPKSLVRFSDISAAGNHQSAWDFGNSTTASGTLTPQLTYTDTGRYKVKLTITDENKCADSTFKDAYIKIANPVASFTMSDSVSYCIPFEVKFKNTSQYYISSVWNLNGAVNRQESPTEYYNARSAYTEKLYVTSPGGCVDSATRRVNVYDTAGLRISYSPLFGCRPLGINVSANAPVAKTFLWDYGDGIIDSTNTLAVNHTYTRFGSFLPKAILTDQLNCIISLTGKDIVKVIGADVSYNADRKLFCDSGLVRFTDSTQSNETITRYEWNFGNGAPYITGASTNPTHFYGTTGFYNTSLKVVTKSGCTDSFHLQPLKIVNSPSISITGDTVICRDEYITHQGVFDRVDTAAVSWSWQFFNSSTSAAQYPGRILYNKDGLFSVTAVATNSSGCKDTAVKSIRVNPLPLITMPATINMQLGYPALIQATYSPNLVSYQWQPSASLSCSNCPQPIANPKINTLYKVSVVDEYTCKSTANVQVIVFCKNANVFVPNTFSPNGDGNNDLFYVRGRGLERVKMLRVFNRWGEVVFEKQNFALNDAGAGWDGRIKGQQAAPGTYIYQIDVFCDNSDTIRFNGDLLLVL